MELDSDAGNGSTSTSTVQRVAAVLDAFLATGTDVGVTELAGQLGLAKSVVHRLVTGLADAEYLAHNTATRRYALGPKVVRLGLVAVGQMSIRQRALPYLRQLAAETGETATLSLLAGDHRVYAEQVESAHPVRQSVQIGQLAQLYLGASGKAILAHLPAPRRAAILQQAAGTRHADGTAVDPQALACELEAIRQRGYATSQSERVVGAASAAAAVFDLHGGVVASVSVASVTVRHGAADLERFGGLAVAYADRLSVELGWSGRPVGVGSSADRRGLSRPRP